MFIKSLSNQPIFNYSYRNTYKHNLCLDMLQDGYHKSFSELFALIKQQEEERLAQGEESLMWTQTMLKDRHQELDKLKFHLTKAEEAMRKGNEVPAVMMLMLLVIY